MLYTPLEVFKLSHDTMLFMFYKDDSGFTVDPGLQVAKAGARKPAKRNAREK